MTGDALTALLAPLSDQDVVALTLYGEARGEPIEGLLAVGCVIRNRVTVDLGHDGRPDWWGEGYRGVCLQPKQFSCWNDGDPTQAAVVTAAQAIMHGTPDPWLAQCLWAAEGVTRDWLRDLTSGATHYHTDAVSPAWAKSMILTVRKGHHLFYRETP